MVEFYGPNPYIGIFYLGALRAAEEMATAVGDLTTAAEYHALFKKGSLWVDEHLFQGEYYKQEVRGFHKDQIAPQLISGFGSDDYEKPEYQVGGGCLIDQLLGQCLAHVAGLGNLVSREHINATLESIYRYNYKRSLVNHDSVQRTYALNDEAAVVICDYGKAPRPVIPFPYYAEAWTGPEHATAALMIYSGMVKEGIEFIENLRSRYDGVKRNPWDEAECGHHYARAMASWSSVVALSGFAYDAPGLAVIAIPRLPHQAFQCFWSTGTGWGSFAYGNSTRASKFNIKVMAGKLALKSIQITGTAVSTSALSAGKTYKHVARTSGDSTLFTMDERMTLEEGQELSLDLHS